MTQSPVVICATEEMILFCGLLREPVAATRNWISRPENGNTRQTERVISYVGHLFGIVKKITHHSQQSGIMRK